MPQEIWPTISKDIPQAFFILMEGFDDQSEHDAQSIFEQAVKSLNNACEFTEYDLNSCYALLRMLNPTNDIEKLWGAQFIICHLLGMHHITLPSNHDRNIGLSLLHAADDAMKRIYEKRYDAPNKTVAGAIDAKPTI